MTYIFASVGCSTRKSGKTLVHAGLPSSAFLAGRTINGVNVRFEISSYDETTARLTGLVHLKNSRNVATEFSWFIGFYRHLKFSDMKGNPVPFESVPEMQEPFFEALSLKPKEATKLKFDLLILDFYRIPPGNYELGFVYDEILLTKRFQSTSKPPIDWSIGTIAIKIPSLN